MDIVQIFNDELHSLVAMKPPVSKAKMGLITRAAMKGVKFYKHIVQSVEKFILRCGAEYKVPGLYVIDSIVRQSRHQFGIERDVYATRFSRNLQLTFGNLFSGCLPEDRPKIVRVLNLWQKNGVFNSQIIQPLLNMATPGSVLPIDPNSLSAASPLENDLDSKQGNSSSSSFHLQHHLNNSEASVSRHQRNPDVGLKFNETMLDFDYDEDDDNNGDETPTEAEPPLSSTLNKIEMEQRGQRTDVSNTNQSSQLHSMRHLEHKQQATNQDAVLERWNRLIKQQSISSDGHSNNEQQQQQQQQQQHKNLEPKRKQVLRSRSRSRSPIHRNSNQISNNNNNNQHELPKELTNQITQKQDSSTPAVSCNVERDTERELERERKCFPKIRDKHLTVCSSTLWLGHVPKTVSEADISDAFGVFGTITSIDLIPPRGCAYVCMDRRQDAKRALNESKDLKLNGSHIKMAWAPGKGFKEYKKLKDFWEADCGSSFIPYSRIDESIDFEKLEEGGVIDEDSMSMEMRERRERLAREKEAPIQNSLPSNVGGLPLTSLHIMTQPPPPPTSLASFSVPPPTNLGIPPPPATLSGQGLIPFPPPNSIVTSNGQIAIPSSSNSLNDSAGQNHPDNVDESPINIDQQLSMTERQINMVEQQLSMIQQAQSMAQPPQPTYMPPIHQQAIFHQNHLNNSIYELAPTGLMHAGQQVLDHHHIAMFAAQPQQLMAQQQPHMMPISQAPSLTDPSAVNGNQSMPQFSRGRF